MLRLLLCLIPVLTCGQHLPGTAPLEWKGDGAELVVSGIHRFLDAYQRPSGKPDAKRLAYILGATEQRVQRPVESLEGVLARHDRYSVRAIRWESVEGVHGDGLMLVPTGTPKMAVIALPDADQSPEAFAATWPHRLASSGAAVIIPLLMDRRSTYSGVQGVRMTNMPHREFLWRQFYPLGRHIIGVEVQKVLAVIDQVATLSAGTPIYMAGYGEGGLIALHAAALDQRIQRALVSGYFGPRDELWKEPVYRDVWGLLPDYRDAALAAMIAPRTLIVEAAPGPTSTSPVETKDRRGAAPHGVLAPFTYEQVAREVARVDGPKPLLIKSDRAGSEAALEALIGGALEPMSEAPRVQNKNEQIRFERQFKEMIDYARRVIRESGKTREVLWAKEDRSPLRALVWDDMIGRLPDPSMPANPRTRLIFDEPKFRGYEVVLDVWPNVNAYGYLLVPKDIKPGEKRAVVVCQHGLEGRPKNVADPTFVDKTYGQFAVRLAEQGFITFSPQNPYVLGDRFRQIGRKAHPWKLTQFSFIAGQHQRILEWLGSLDFVDAKRMGFYGLSYGGYTAMRIPALLENYALSICSGNFTEWVWKVASLDAPYVYPLTQEYDIPEFNLAHIANYAELASLIFPRPFYVERGHRDGVSWDEWVAFEYAKVFRFYSQKGLKDRTEIEYFDGPHQIHGVGTFEFLKKHLR
jgi:cephalosporin-C deacetylase-like acetyl esterase